jgi:predicted aspartyl protease
LSLKSFTYPYRPPPRFRKEKKLKDIPLYPLLNVKLYPKNGKPICFEGLLDSGADGVFIPKQIAEAMGLQKIERISTSGIFKSARCFKTKVGFILGVTKSNSIDFGMIEAVFPEDETDIPLLIGRNPIFKFFEVTFSEYKEKPRVTLNQKKHLPK